MQTENRIAKAMVQFDPLNRDHAYFGADLNSYRKSAFLHRVVVLLFFFLLSNELFSKLSA